MKHAAGVLALAFFLLHLPYLPSSLEDLDSINFALGLRHFDVRSHQPHPPGYPVFILLGKAAHKVIQPEARALASVSVATASLAVFAITALFRRLRSAESNAWSTVGAAIAISSPLYWFTAARPLSDMAGLAAALSVQALVLAANRSATIEAAAFLGGLATGIRSQVFWLTFPTILWCARADRRIRAVVAFGAGVLAWFVPLVVLTGGPVAYWQTLFNQGSEDLSGIRMLWTTPTLREALDAFYFAFVAPWATWISAAAVLVLAGAGLRVLLREDRRAFTLLALAFGPYLMFDIVFQETFTSRYALPLVVPVAFLAFVGLARLPRRIAVVGAVVLIAFHAHVGGRSIAVYSREIHPAFRLMADMQSEAKASERRPVLAPDRRQLLDLRRPLLWLGGSAPHFERQLPAPPQHEWLEAVRYWNTGGRAPVWFAIDPLRTSLAMVQHGDPISYRWGLPYPVLSSGTRPGDVDWYRVERPEWYLGEGWALTPETAGVAAAERQGLAYGPIEGWIRRDALAGGGLAIGGRNLDPMTNSRVSVTIDAQPVVASTVRPGGFLEVVRLTGDHSLSAGDYARMVVAAEPPGPLAVEEFDVSATRGVLGFGEGWHEPELNPETGARWRWVSDRGQVRYLTQGGNAVLHIEGEAARRYYKRDSRFVVRAGALVLLDTSIADDFALDVSVPPAADVGTLTIETDQTHIPADSRWSRSRDRRTLGLRIFRCELRPVSAQGTKGSFPPAR